MSGKLERRMRRAQAVSPQAKRDQRQFERIVARTMTQVAAKRAASARRRAAIKDALILGGAAVAVCVILMLVIVGLSS